MANSCFAAARRADKREGIALVYLKRYAVQDFLLARIIEANVFKGYASFKAGNAFSLRRVLLGRRIHNLAEAAEACCAVLELLNKGNKRANGV